MEGKEGRCGLCGKSAELRNGHLLPAALYKLLRYLPSERNSSPVHVTTKKVLSSDKQITAYFLCGCCEQRFSANGERRKGKAAKGSSLLLTVRNFLGCGFESWCCNLMRYLN